MMTVDEKINYLNQLGVHFDSNTLNIRYSQNTYAKNCPKLFYDKELSEFALFYQSTNNNELGQQAFYFNELHFLEAYNEKKYKNYTSKKTYKTFDEIFFNQYYPYAEPLVHLIFDLFDINPTTLNKAFNIQTSSRKTSGKRRQPLKLKEAKTIKNVFAPVMMSFAHNSTCGQKTNSTQKQNQNNQPNELNDNVNEQLIQKYAALAAKHYDISTYFVLYLKQYCTLNNISPSTQSSKKFQTSVVKNVLMKKFCKLVDKLQSNVL